MTLTKLKYKDFTGSIEFDEEYQVYHGEIEGIDDLYAYEGETIEEMEKVFREFVDEYIKDKNIIHTAV